MEKITSLLIAAPVLLALNFAQSMSPVEQVEKEYIKSSMLRPNKSDIFCTEQYDPVCGVIETYCLKPPCPLEAKTFSNECYAEKAGAINITKGPC